MFNFDGHRLQFCSYSDIANQRPTWIAQTCMDRERRSLNIWLLNEQYYITISV